MKFVDYFEQDLKRKGYKYFKSEGHKNWKDIISFQLKGDKRGIVYFETEDDEDYEEIKVNSYDKNNSNVLNFAHVPPKPEMGGFANREDSGNVMVYHITSDLYKTLPDAWDHHKWGHHGDLSFKTASDAITTAINKLSR